MTDNLISLYQQAQTANRVVNELVELGCKENRIKVLGGENANSAAVEKELTQELRDRGIAEAEARSYVHAVKGGKILVLAEAPDKFAEIARSVMEDYEAEDRERASSALSTKQGEEETIPVVEEELKVGKRASTGTVRARKVVTEQPVEEHVRLRQETVDVERRPTDRRLSAEEKGDAFEESAVELSEMREEAVASKEARVVEEVALRKTVAEREETVRDTVRRTDVEVERTDSEPRRKR